MHAPEKHGNQPQAIDCLYSNVVVRCPALLAYRLGTSAQIYFLARGIDTSGSGWAVLDIKEAAKACGKQPDTVRRNIHWCKAKGLFRHVEQINKNLWLVYYEAQVKAICRKAAYTDQGFIPEFVVGEGTFHKNLFIPAITAMAMEHLQEQNEHALNKLKDSPPPITAEETHKATRSDYVPGPMSPIVGSTKRFVLVNEGTPAVQSSQRTAAFRYGKNPRTINRHVRRTKRYGLLQSTQIMRVIADDIALPEIGEEFADHLNMEQQIHERDIAFRYEFNRITYNVGKLTKVGSFVLRYECSAYIGTGEYKKARSLNRRVKRYAATLADNPLCDLPDRWAHRRSEDRKTGKRTLKAAKLLGNSPNSNFSNPPSLIYPSINTLEEHK
jgi:hypothetical protein